MQEHLLDEKEFVDKIKLDDERKLPRFRFHYFFRNIEGLWASVNPDDIDNKPGYRDDERTAGKLYSTTQINSNKGNRILELLYCDNCGTTFFGGSRSIGKNKTWELLPLSPKIEGIPEKTPGKLVDKRTYQEYGVFWVQGKQVFTKHTNQQGNEQDDWNNQPLVNPNDTRNFVAKWIPAILNIKSGDVDTGNKNEKDNPNDWINGRLFEIKFNDNDVAKVDWLKLNNNNKDTHFALPCVSS